MKNQKLPASFYNPVSLTGAAIASVSFVIFLLMMLFEMFSSESKPYVGIITFIILPSFLILGLLLIAIGIIREHKRQRSGKTRENIFPVVDLNNPRYRTAAIIFSLGTIVLLLLTAFGSFKAYEYTDSNEFCGTMCHKVMEPEFTAYKNSPHARVDCVKCHIGPGAGWFVRSKLSGAYQVYSVIFDKYPKPIPTPIENLRPARETCEQCHWPKAFYSEKRHDNTYYVSNEENSKWSLVLLMKIGGGNEESGVTSGIHWHMNIKNKITYLPTDSSRMVIPWVKAETMDGDVSVYKSTEFKITDELLESDSYRTMDCIDCHNRPSHQFHPPMRSVNHVMALGWIDPELPYIKSIAVQALEGNYNKKEIGLREIKSKVEDFYIENYPDVYAAKKDKIDKAVKEISKIYKRNYFPYMNADWRHFPDQIGHMYSPGCFRCHDGKHVTDDGKVLSNDCNLCHTLLAQNFEDKEIEFSLSGVDYKHPVNIGDSWQEIGCYNCHTRKR